MTTPSDKPGRAQRLEISLDGGCACALWGQDLQDGEAVFVKIDGWPNATHKQEQAAMREAYELLCKAIGDRLPFDIVREHAKPSVALPETGTNNEAGLAPPEGQITKGGVEAPASPTSDTPRTDARWNELYDQGGNTITWFEVAERVRDFARQLERKLASKTRDADHFFQLSGRYLEELNAVQSASGHPFDFRGYTTTNTSAAEPVSTTQERKA